MAYYVNIVAREFISALLEEHAAEQNGTDGIREGSAGAYTLAEYITERLDPWDPVSPALIFQLVSELEEEGVQFYGLALAIVKAACDKLF